MSYRLIDNDGFFFAPLLSKAFLLHLFEWGHPFENVSPSECREAPVPQLFDSKPREERKKPGMKQKML